MPVYKCLMLFFLLFVWSYLYFPSFCSLNVLLFRPLIYLDSTGLNSVSFATELASFDLKSVRTHDKFSVYASFLRSDLGWFSWNFHFFPIYSRSLFMSLLLPTFSKPTKILDLLTRYYFLIPHRWSSQSQICPY